MWAAVRVHAVQSVYDLMPRPMTVVVAVEVAVLDTDLLGSMFPNFLKNQSLVISNVIYLSIKYRCVSCTSS